MLGLAHHAVGGVYVFDVGTHAQHVQVLHEVHAMLFFLFYSWLLELATAVFGLGAAFEELTGLGRHLQTPTRGRFERVIFLHS